MWEIFNVKIWPTVILDNDTLYTRNVIVDLKYTSYWEIDKSKDIFNFITDINVLQKKVFDYMVNSNENIVDIIDDKILKFTRISAQEYIYGKQARILSQSDIDDIGLYRYKMRLAPSIGDLIKNSNIKYHSPLKHTNKLFTNGFNNYQGNVVLEDVLFKYIVRVGKAKNDNIFYDLNLEYKGKVKEIEQTVPSVNTRRW